MVVIGEGQFFLHTVGFPRRRFTVASDTNNGVGMLLLFDDRDGTAPRILLVSSCLMSYSTSTAAVDGSSENSKMVARRFMVVFVCLICMYNVVLYYKSGEG